MNGSIHKNTARRSRHPFPRPRAQFSWGQKVFIAGGIAIIILLSFSVAMLTSSTNLVGLAVLNLGGDTVDVLLSAENTAAVVVTLQEGVATTGVYLELSTTDGFDVCSLLDAADLKKGIESGLWGDFYDVSCVNKILYYSAATLNRDDAIGRTFSILEFKTPLQQPVNFQLRTIDVYDALTAVDLFPDGQDSMEALLTPAGEFCGDGVQQVPEQCDNGVANSDVAPDACRTDCTTSRCGDGMRDSSEQCDDGNAADGDGCTGACRSEGAVENCVNGIDDDNDISSDCYDTDCNGQVGPNGFNCEVSLEVTCNDANDNDYNGQIDCNDVNCNGKPGPKGSNCLFVGVQEQPAPGGDGGAGGGAAGGAAGGSSGGSSGGGGGGGKRCVPALDCGVWTPCNTNLQQSRSCTDANHCSGKAIVEIRACTPCTESWTCGAWSSCINGQQTRTCTDAYACGTVASKPAEQRTCVVPKTTAGTGPVSGKQAGLSAKAAGEVQKPLGSGIWKQYKSYFIAVPSAALLIIVLLIGAGHFIKPKKLVFDATQLQEWVRRERAAGEKESDLREIFAQNTGWDKNEVDIFFARLRG